MDNQGNTMTPAQTHIATQIMGCIPDLSTLEFFDGVAPHVEGIWFDWKEAGLGFGAHINHNASGGWVCTPNMNIHFQKYIDVLPDKFRTTMTLVGNEDDGSEKDMMIEWYTPTLDDLLPF
jgi:hypothetical protein